MITTICKQCQKEFQVKPYRIRMGTVKYCSKQCQKLCKQAPTIQLTCPTCQKTFTREKWKQKSSYSGNYCSTKCYRLKSPQVEVTCPCGNTFKTYRSRITYYNTIYCNRKCYQKYGYFGRLLDEVNELSNYEIFIRSLRSTAKYLHWKQECLRQDNKQCVNCRSDKDLTVHHIITMYDLVKIHGLNKEMIEQDPIFLDVHNGITLCRSCHLKQHIRKENE